VKKKHSAPNPLSIANATKRGSKKFSVLISVSGGADSMYLTWLLAHSFSATQLQAIYFDHGLRDFKSIQADKNVISTQCHQLGIPFTVQELPITTTAKRTQNSIETTARLLRRDALYAHAKAESCTHIALGHHLDDHIETILFQLIRGSQSLLTGIKKISYIQDIPIMRPLLELTKEDILKQVRQHKIIYHEDDTNTDTTMTRNKIRHQLIPIIKDINSNYTQKIDQFVQYHNDAQRFIKSQLEDALSNITVTKTQLQLPTEIFRSLKNKFLQQNWIRYSLKRWINQLPESPSAQIDAVHIIAISQLFTKETHKQCSIPSPFCIKKMKDYVLISTVPL
jgi:tRNA(Ile)-lysidine synthase